MKTKTFLLFIALTLCSTSTYAQKERWESLFNGKDISKWKVYGQPKDVLKQYWKVENSVIVALQIHIKDDLRIMYREIYVRVL